MTANGAKTAENFWIDHIKGGTRKIDGKDKQFEGVLNHSCITLMSDSDPVIKGDRWSTIEGTALHCSDPSHPLARGLELPFPFVTVVDCPTEDMVARMGHTLIYSHLTTIGEGDPVVQAAMRARHIDQVHFGWEPTTAISGDALHEGNRLGHAAQNRTRTPRRWMVA